jgi:metal-sulfur cluster biosynthetic enzyme
LVRGLVGKHCSELKVVPEHIRSINDPEHPLTLEQLAVVSAPQVEVNGNHVLVEFTPTVPHCGASTLIGACCPLMR